MMIVGVTGGIGSGKTTVTDLFAELGISVVDTDVNARRVVEPGSAGLIQITKKFGDQVLLPDKTLNRRALREIIFSDPDAKTWLESLLHPLIHNLTTSELQNASSPYCVLSSPLLLETSDKDRVDRILVIDVPMETQLSRAMKRDSADENQIRAIIASQMHRDERLALANDVIDNSGSLELTHKQVLDLHERYIDISSEN